MSREKIIEERREEVVLSENSVPTPSKLGGKYKNTEPEKPVFVLLNGNETEEFCVVMVPLMWPWNTLKTPPHPLLTTWIFISPISLSTRPFPFPQSIVFSQELKVSPQVSGVNGFFLLPSHLGSHLGLCVFLPCLYGMWQMVWFRVGKRDAAESFHRTSSIWLQNCSVFLSHSSGHMQLSVALELENLIHT